jgi:hypothetical protein
VGAPWGDPVGPSHSALSPQSLQSLQSSLLQWQSPESSTGLNFQSLTRVSSSQSDACGSSMDTPCASLPMRLPALQGPHTIADLIEGHTFQILTRIVRARCPKPVVTSEVQASADMLQAPFDECVEIFRMGKDLLEQWDSRYQAFASTRLPLPPPPPTRSSEYACWVYHPHCRYRACDRHIQDTNRYIQDTDRHIQDTQDLSGWFWECGRWWCPWGEEVAVVKDVALS